MERPHLLRRLHIPLEVRGKSGDFPFGAGTLWLRAAIEGKALLRTSLETFELCGDGAFRGCHLVENFTGEKFSTETDSKLK